MSSSEAEAAPSASEIGALFHTGQSVIVKPDNGRRETLWVTLVMILILLAGALGIMLRQVASVAADPYAELNGNQRQLLTELSIAMDEIRFMTLAGAPWPDLTELQALGVSPFAQSDNGYLWAQVEPGCFQTQVSSSKDGRQQGAFLLRLGPDGGVLFHQEQTPPLTACHDLHHWIILMELQ